VDLGFSFIIFSQNKLIVYNFFEEKKIKLFLVVSEVSKAGDFYHWPFFLKQLGFRTMA
jgi:hypothetical protein